MTGIYMEKTLYVSDLDGTLMRNNEKLSQYTVSVINELVENGLSFTYATARSVESARAITGDLKLKLPVITRNGAVLADNTTGKHLKKSVFTKDEVELLKTMLPEISSCGFVSCFTDDIMIRTYMPGEHTEGLQGYIDYYENDPTLRKAYDLDELYCGLPGYVTMIGEMEKIAPIYEKAKEYKGWESMFQKDTYRDEYWLEICPQNCTKAKTILKLKEEFPSPCFPSCTRRHWGQRWGAFLARTPPDHLRNRSCPRGSWTVDGKHEALLCPFLSLCAF